MNRHEERQQRPLWDICCVFMAFALLLFLPASSALASPYYTGPQVGQFGEDIDALGRHVFPLRFIPAKQAALVLMRQGLPPGITKVETDSYPDTYKRYNYLFVTGTWRAVARLHQKIVQLDVPPRQKIASAGMRPSIRITLTHLYVPMQTLRHLGFNPYAPGLDADESTGHQVTARLLQSVQKSRQHLISDGVVTPLDGRSVIVSSLRPHSPGERASYLHIIYPPAGFHPGPGYLLNVDQQRLIITPHVLWRNRLMYQAQFDEKSGGIGNANSWAASGETILLLSQKEVSPVYLDARRKILKSDGLVLLIFATGKILLSQ